MLRTAAASLLILGSLGLANPVLTVGGSPAGPGERLKFHLSNANPRHVAFLGVSSALGETNFGFFTMQIAWPIVAYGMGGVNQQGFVDRELQIPGDLPPGLDLTLYVQCPTLHPNGSGGYDVEVSNVVSVVIRS